MSYDPLRASLHTTTVPPDPSGAARKLSWEFPATQTAAPLLGVWADEGEPKKEEITASKTALKRFIRPPSMESHPTPGGLMIRGHLNRGSPGSPTALLQR